MYLEKSEDRNSILQGRNMVYRLRGPFLESPDN